MKSYEAMFYGKKAVLYPRVSTHKQKVIGYSYEAQEDRMKNFCASVNMEVVKVFREDHSAKSFKNRKVFQELYEFIQKNRKDIDYLLFTKFDRFARNRDESMDMWKKIERLGIKIIPIEEPTLEDGPAKLLIESILHTLPEVDNLIRSETVKRGMRAAARQGRHVAKAPFGYNRIPATNKYEKSRLEINVSNAIIVREIFNRLIDGEPLNVIRKSLMPRGFKLSKTQIYRLIQNPVYMGKIKIKAWDAKNEAEELVEGQHPAIVSESIFWAAQQALKKKLK